MRRVAAATLTLFALWGAVAIAQEPENTPPAAPEAAETAAAPADAPQSKPLIAPPPKLSGPEFRRMRGITAPPPSPSDQEKIANFFYHLKKLIEDAEAKPLPEPKKPEESAKQPQSYGFEDIEGFTSRDMMRAIREGTDDARINNINKPQAYIDRMIEANIRFVLEYYPLVAVDPDAKNNLFYAMEDTSSEPVLRRLLYSLAIPGRGHDSLFARYLQQAARSEDERVTKMYGVSLSTQGDDPVVRQMAAENLYHGRNKSLRDFVAADANAKAYAEANGRVPEPIELLDPAKFSISNANKVRLKKEISNLEDLAKLMGSVVKPTSGALDSLRDGVTAVLKRMQAEIPFEDREFITGLLNQAEAAPQTSAPAPTPDADALAF